MNKLFKIALVGTFLACAAGCPTTSDKLPTPPAPPKVCKCKYHCSCGPTCVCPEVKPVEPVVPPI